MKSDCGWPPPISSLAVASILLAHVAMLVYTAMSLSPTFDEAAYLPAGISHWRFGRFELYRACPHLVRSIASIPVLATDAKTDWTRYAPAVGRMPEFAVGHDFISANGKNAYRYFTLARLACIPFSLLGAWMCFHWARELYGYASGVLALILWCFDPNIIAHGSLLTSDIATTSLSCLTIYLFGKWLSEPTARRAILTGAALGMLLLTRMNSILLLAYMPAAWVALKYSSKRSLVSLKQQFGQLACIICIGVYVLNLGYLFDGSFRPLGDYKFASKSLGEASGHGNRFKGTWAHETPVPLPADYVLGIDTLKRNFESNSKLAYLRGEFRSKGWWYYYLYGLIVKVPLGTWGLVILSGAVGWRYRTRIRDEITILAPAACYLAFTSSQVGLNSHVRYVLPIAPFAFVWTSKLAKAVEMQDRKTLAIIATCLLLLITSSMRALPNGLSYFNELAGGALRGHDHLLDSNIDWGQDLRSLQAWIDQHPESKPLGIAFFGSYSPSDVGIDFRLPPMHPPLPGQPVNSSGPRPGYFAVSVNFLRGYRFAVFDSEGKRHWLSEPCLTYFQSLEPVDRAGYSIYIYHVSEADAEHLRRELGYPPLNASSP